MVSPVSSGSGKSSFCGVLSAESKKRLVTLLPKVEYQFLFPDLIRTNYGAFDISEIPLIHYLRNHTVNLSPRSTIGTHTGIFRAVRARFATESRTSSEFFSFNLPLNWCPKCKGRGSIHRVICPQCKGTRYSNSVLRHKLKTASGSFDIASVNGLAIETIVQLADDLGCSPESKRLQRISWQWEWAICRWIVP